MPRDPPSTRAGSPSAGSCDPRSAAAAAPTVTTSSHPNTLSPPHKTHARHAVLHRASPRLAEKVQRSTSSGRSWSEIAAPAPPSDSPASAVPATSAPAPAVPSTTPMEVSATGTLSLALSVASTTNSPSLSSTATSPSMLSAIHTPLSKRGSGHGATLQTPHSAYAHTPSPISLPPPQLTARRKLITYNNASASSFSAHPQHLPPSSARSPSQSGSGSKRSSLLARTVSAQGPDGDTPMANEGALLRRAVSCPPPNDGAIAQKLQSHVEGAVSFVSPRTAALLISARQAGAHPVQLSPAPSPAEEALMREYRTMYDHVHVLDARFPYEYEGGHIKGAVNVTSHAQAEEMLLKTMITSASDASTTLIKSQSVSSSPPTNTAPASGFARPVTRALVAAPQAQTPATVSTTAAAAVPSPAVASASPESPRLSDHGSGSRVAILIHCEFSRHRGPKCFQFLRKRDREIMGTARYPELAYPEIYVISGGYQAFFNGGNAALCEPREYVSMTDRRFMKEYALSWRKMKQSQQEKKGSGSVGGSPAMKSSPYASLSPGGLMYPSEPSSGGSAGGSGSKGMPLQRRTSRARSFSAMMDNVLASNAHTAAAATSAAMLGGRTSPGFPPSIGQHSPIPTHNRVSRGLSLTLDSAASASGAGAGGGPAGLPGRRPTASAFTFHGSASATALGSPLTSSASALPTIHSPPFMPCASPSPTYGWSTEGRSSTPSPFQGLVESPRASSSSNFSPLPLWHSPVPSDFGIRMNGTSLMTPIAQPQGSAPGSGANRRGGGAATPLSSPGDESPRSAPPPMLRARAASLSTSWSLTTPPPPVLVQSHQVTDGSITTVPVLPASSAMGLTGAHSPGVFVSPQHPGARQLSQSHSPSSAMHSMHLRSSPSMSLGVYNRNASAYSPSLSASMTDIHRYESASSPSLSVCPSMSSSSAMDIDMSSSELSPSVASRAAAATPASVEPPQPQPQPQPQARGERTAKKMRRAKSDADANLPQQLLTAEIPPPQENMRD